jgi:hypothetical protein
MGGTSVLEWPPREVSALRRRLDELAALVETREPLLQEARDWLSRLLVIRSSGYLEQAVVEVGRGYIAAKSGGPARSFAHSWLERSANPTPEALLVLAGRFDPGWSSELDGLLEADDQRLLREVSFLVDRRNKIAHGLNEGIGPVKALALKEIACEVADWFVLRFNPER